MGMFVRRVTTGSGATAVQIVSKVRGQREILEHLGSGHSDDEVAALVAVGWQKIEAMIGTQQTLDLGLDESEVVVPVTAEKKVTGSASRMLVDTIRACYDRLGFSVQVADEAFFQMLLARLVDPTSKRDSLRVLTELGVDTVHHNTLLNALKRAQDRDYRGRIAQACFDHSLATTGMSLLRYDVTTLYFEAEKEDDYRKIGYSKERHVDPQIVVGLLVDRAGFPLEIHSFEGNTAETHTILPVLTAFQQRHQVADMVVVADAGMLSDTNLAAIDAAGLRFIVGSKQTTAPRDLAAHFHHRPETTPDDGTTVDTVTTRGRYQPDPDRLKDPAEPLWDPAGDGRHWRVVWQYRTKRASLDVTTLDAKRQRAMKVV